MGRKGLTKEQVIYYLTLIAQKHKMTEIEDSYCFKLPIVFAFILLLVV